MAKVLCVALNSERERVIICGLSCVKTILEKGKIIQEEEKLETNPFRYDMESEGTATFIENLQHHRSDEIYGKVSKIIDAYFESEQK